ncbi:tryptophan 2,3-dioxygenase family protein [Actinoallomurus sp. CA-150999]|uniref:tryptophan 2,3-dioxygenase family protein n=1 Tax=Actinoallomurus sp. CA-150999 TaxID=3239887 RepID=UPI003D8EB211
MEREAAIGRIGGYRSSVEPERGEAEQGESLLGFTGDRGDEGGMPCVGYRDVEVLLGLRYPRTDQWAELSFYATGKVQELLFKLLFTEVNWVRDLLLDDVVGSALWRLRRVGHVQRMLIASWEQLSSVTPAEFATLRDELGGIASRSQSLAYRSFWHRRLEFALGGKSPEMVAAYAAVPRLHAVIEATLREPSLYDAVLALLRRKGADIPVGCVERDITRPYEPHPAVERAWAEIYREASGEMYSLAEALTGLDHRYAHWRTTHLLTVRRLLDHTPETGRIPSAEHRFFPELRAARSKA